MPHTNEIKALPVPHHLIQGAHNAIRNCLSVTSSDKVLVICDEKAMNIAAALVSEAEKAGAAVKCTILERLAPRPMKQWPTPLAEVIKGFTVSIYVVTMQPGEHAHRSELVNLVDDMKLRHAHMPGVTEDAMCQGMLSDFSRIARLNPIMIKKIQGAKTIKVTSTAGTDVTVVLDPAEEWESSAGIIQAGRWDNLPNGEIMTCPKTVDGVFYCDNIIPAAIPVDRFQLSRNPVAIHLENGRAVKIEGGTDEIRKAIEKNISMGSNMDRIGMFGVGTNYDLMLPIGDSTQDQFVPGAQFAFGRIWSTNPTWSTQVQFPMMGRKTSLWLDDVAVIDKGRYAQEVLESAS